MQWPPTVLGGAPITLHAALDRALAWRQGERTLSVVACRLALNWRTSRGGGTYALALPLLVIERRDGVERRHPVPHVTLAVLVATLGVAAAPLLWSACRSHARK
jgi:hypothetical protein